MYVCVCVCVNVCEALFTPSGSHVLCLYEEARGLNSVIQQRLRGFIYLKHAQLVVSGLALCEWGFN